MKKFDVHSEFNLNSSHESALDKIEAIRALAQAAGFFVSGSAQDTKIFPRADKKKPSKPQLPSYGVRLAPTNVGSNKNKKLVVGLRFCYAEPRHNIEVLFGHYTYDDKFKNNESPEEIWEIIKKNLLEE